MTTLQIFSHILQREFSGPSQHLSRKFTEWCYGPVRVSLYDLASVDSWEENSVLEIIAFHCKSPQADSHLKAEVGNSMLLAGHIFILLAGLYILVGQALLTVLSQVLCFLAIEWYLPLLVSALVLGWLNLLYYTRGFQHTGIYSVMIQKVILRDLLRFLLVYLVFLFGFAVALVSLSQEAWRPEAPTGSNATESLQPVEGQKDKENMSPYGNILEASLELFKFTIGMGELAFEEQLHFRGMVLLLLLAYVLLTYILLLNMLIALMNETVNSVATDSWSIWKLQVPPGRLPAPTPPHTQAVGSARYPVELGLP
ncbi:Transient receptor putative cation channel sub V member 2 [Saguinus oedipus]|uniref:Transient receptor putative cation channel sub V member 2 n=1 Tax=Saguinus oedipus TaxID=9490 RepID=A0ABQ9VNX9_SAGOE|nr:Transient receptor putative cation channel sub V member 2 [Saguinus oedipus]